MLSLDLTEIDIFQGDLKTLSKVNFEKLRKEILETGYAFAMHVWQEPKSNRWKLVDGTQRFKTLTHLVTKEGYECDLLPVVPVAADDFKQAKRRVLQGTSQYGEMTGDGLYEFMSEAELGFDELDAFRLPDIDIEDFREEFEEQTGGGHSPEDEVPEVKPDDKRVKLGDLFILGDHKLLCGDSTDKATVDRLMGGEKADMVFTDPPYELETKGGGLLKESTAMKKIKELGIDKFNPMSLVKNADTSIFCCNKPLIEKYIQLAKEWQVSWDLAIYHKKNITPNYGGHLMTDLEYIFVIGAQSPRTGIGADKEMYSKLFSGGKDLENETPWSKPVALCEKFIKLYSEKRVLDLFGGSGSTLIACEKTKRKCFMMELDPTYCAVILDRWAKFTNLDPVREDGKKWSELVPVN